MESKPIVEFLMGDEITGFYYLNRADLKSRRDKQGTFLALDLSDASGHIAAHVWEDADTVAKSIRAGDVVKLQGNVQSFQGRKQLVIQRIRPVNTQDEVDMSRIIASIGKKVDQLWREYARLATSVVNPFLRSLLRKFTEDEDFREKFCQAPANRNAHHSYLGGLLEHSVAVCKLCEKMSGVYEEIDADLLITAALLHDVGKVHAFQTGPSFDLTDSGKLLGSTVIGLQILQQRIADIPAFPAELTLKLQHLLLSPQPAKKESPVVEAMTAEAIILHHADQLDCVQNLFQRARKRDKKAGELWSHVIKSLDRQFYLG